MKTLHQDYGRREGPMGFRRANCRATLDVYNMGAYPPAVLCFFFTQPLYLVILRLENLPSSRVPYRAVAAVLCPLSSEYTYVLCPVG